MNPYLKFSKASVFFEEAKADSLWTRNHNRARVTWSILVAVCLIFLLAVLFGALGGSAQLKLYSGIGFAVVLLLGVLVCFATDAAAKPDKALLQDAARSVVRLSDSRLVRVRWNNLSSPEMRFDSDLFHDALAHPGVPGVQVMVLDHVTRLRVYRSFADVTSSVTLPEQNQRKEVRFLIFSDTPDYATIIRRLDNRYNNVS